MTTIATYDAMPAMQDAMMRNLLSLCLLGTSGAAGEALARALRAGACAIRRHGREPGRLWAALQAGETEFHVVCDLARRRVEAIEQRVRADPPPVRALAPAR